MNKNKQLPIACSIAGSDSCGGAGIQADLRTFALHGVHGASVVTALTAQNTLQVCDIQICDVDFVVTQLKAVVTDLSIQVFKTGMLANSAIVEAVALLLTDIPDLQLVLDPVMVSTSGQELYEFQGIDLLQRKLFPLATIVTPNIAEAEQLLGQNIVLTEQAIEDAARRLYDRFGTAVLLKGGHSLGAANDVLVTEHSVQWLQADRIMLGVTHGTGCHLSAAITARLALGESLVDAVYGAKYWLTDALKRSVPIGQGGVSPWPQSIFLLSTLQ
ncbi:hydroxymethylpyrimidine/phosphomethylpyrimidine kinase-like [Ylistrum balloti]|uniref:hydroxymethylpyrimidine/phosphomethylpyrimidine kinase-like n=1 Tax=Ylistrum balloti TaxID=509963 RepID=UPI0029059B85|nr:hydroxymethylpyrimidine/phosphomethylpyrimidine kinase-like [Ylistrum balloti]